MSEVSGCGSPAVHQYIDSTHNGIGDYKSRNSILRGASALQYLAAWLQLTTARNG